MRFWLKLVTVFILFSCWMFFFWILFLSPKPKPAGLPPVSSHALPKIPFVSAAAASQKRVPILMYHHIRQSQPQDNHVEKGLDVSPTAFEAQMKFLAAKGYHSILLKEIFTHPGGRLVVITFDDGYKDVIEKALNILQKYHFQAVAFIIVDKVGQPGYLTWDDIARLESAGWEIGSHTLSHPDLTKINKEKAKKEIQESKAILERHLHKPVYSFSYPAGRLNSEVVKMVQGAGYQEAVTTRFGVEEKTKERYQLPRVRVSGFDSWHSFVKKITTFFP